MSKYKIINLFDKLFITCAVFLIVYAWINFFIKNLFATFVISLFFSFAIVFVIFYMFNKKQEKTVTKKKYLEDVEQKFLAFRLLSKSNQLFLINSIIQKDFNSKILNNSIAYKNKDTTHLILIATNIQSLTDFDLINLLQETPKADEIEILCNDYSPNINTKILANTNIVLTTKKSLYDNYFYKHSIYPNCEILNQKTNSFSFKKMLKNFIVPNKTKPYFFCGLILIFSSIILPYHFYYLIFGSALLVLSIWCKLKGKFIH